MYHNDLTPILRSEKHPSQVNVGASLKKGTPPHPPPPAFAVGKHR